MEGLQAYNQGGHFEFLKLSPNDRPAAHQARATTGTPSQLGEDPSLLKQVTPRRTWRSR